MTILLVFSGEESNQGAAFRVVNWFFIQNEHNHVRYESGIETYKMVLHQPNDLEELHEMIPVRHVRGLAKGLVEFHLRIRGNLPVLIVALRGKLEVKTNKCRNGEKYAHRMETQ